MRIKGYTNSLLLDRGDHVEHHHPFLPPRTDPDAPARRRDGDLHERPVRDRAAARARHPRRRLESASTAPQHVHAATAAAATAPAEANPTPAATVVEPSHHTVAATPVADNHTPYPAELPPLVDGVKQVKMTLKDVTSRSLPASRSPPGRSPAARPGP